jgi:YesN/AraC family two-component response regulator
MNKLRILLVDDEAIILIGWQKELEPEGYDVRTALTGREAVEMAKEEKPDIVITDLVIPDMNGVEICRKIKEMYPDTNVVLVSGHPVETKNYVMDFINAGGRDEYLRKPLIEDEIRNTIKKIAEGRK